MPLTGAGTYADPRRPIFAPTGVESKDGGIIEYRWTPSDDGRYAVVEFVALDRKALQPILSDPELQYFVEFGKEWRRDGRSGVYR